MHVSLGVKNQNPFMMLGLSDGKMVYGGFHLSIFQALAQSSNFKLVLNGFYYKAPNMVLDQPNQPVDSVLEVTHLKYYFDDWSIHPTLCILRRIHCHAAWCSLHDLREDGCLNNSLKQY